MTRSAVDSIIGRVRNARNVEVLQRLKSASTVKLFMYLTYHCKSIYWSSSSLELFYKLHFFSSYVEEKRTDHRIGPFDPIRHFLMRFFKTHVSKPKTIKANIKNATGQLHPDLCPAVMENCTLDSDARHLARDVSHAHFVLFKFSKCVMKYLLCMCRSVQMIVRNMQYHEK